MKVGFVNLLKGMYISKSEVSMDEWTIKGSLQENREVSVEVNFKAHYPERVEHLMRLGGLISMRFEVLVDGYRAAHGHISPDEMEEVANFFRAKTEKREREDAKYGYEQIEHLLKP